MEAHIKLPFLTVKVQGGSQKELFKNIASACEVFGEKQCGVCGSENICPKWRVVTSSKKVYEYPEWQCQEPSCRAKMSMGCSQDAVSLFPKRRLDPKTGRPMNSDEEGGTFKNNGWSKYRGEDKE